MWKQLQISAFNDFIGHPISAEDKLSPCGTMTLSIDSEGIFFPCIRYADYSLRTKPARTIGDLSHGIDKTSCVPWSHLSITPCLHKMYKLRSRKWMQMVSSREL